MFKIAMVDDDTIFLDYLEKLCNVYFIKNNLECEITKIDSTQTSFDFFKGFDLAFLDIEMPNITGIDIAKMIRKENKQIFLCFVTNFIDYAVESYGTHAFDYILKPISQTQIDKFFNEIFLYYSSEKETTFERFLSIDGLIEVPSKEIIYFEYCEKSDLFCNRIVLLHTKKHQIAIKSNISDVFKNLKNNTYVVPHKSFIINMTNVKQIYNDRIIMSSNEEIPLSQKKRTNIKQEFKNYLKQALFNGDHNDY